MPDTNESADIGFLLTKGPVETGLVEGALRTAKEASSSGRSISIFLLSDGVWLAKKGAKNASADMFIDLIADGAAATASGDHLMAAGIAEDDVIEGVGISKRPYKDLVVQLMEEWDRGVVI